MEEVRLISYTFTVNGIKRTTDENKPLLRYLRDDLKLYSVKDGCSEGACGTCTIVVDGHAVKACVLTTERAEGKNIITVEGLSLREKEAFVYAFGTAGSVQCGFCIPGMVMAGKALIDSDPDAYMKAQGQKIVSFDEKGKQIQMPLAPKRAYYEHYSTE